MRRGAVAPASGLGPRRLGVAKRKAGPAAPRSARATARTGYTARVTRQPRRRRSGAHTTRYEAVSIIVHTIRRIRAAPMVSESRSPMTTHAGETNRNTHSGRRRTARLPSGRDRRHAAYSRQTPNGLTKPSDPDTTANSDTKRVSNGVHSRDCSAHHGQGLLAARTPSAPHPER